MSKHFYGNSFTGTFVLHIYLRASLFVSKR